MAEQYRKQTSRGPKGSKWANSTYGSYAPYLRKWRAFCKHALGDPKALVHNKHVDVFFAKYWRYRTVTQGKRTGMTVSGGDTRKCIAALRWLKVCICGHQ